MPSFSHSSSDYVQWQTARRQQAAQAAKEAAIDFIQQYNRPDDDSDNNDNRPYHRRSDDNHVSLSLDPPSVSGAAENGHAGGQGKGVNRTAGGRRAAGGLSVEQLVRQSGVFTEGLSALSRRPKLPLSLQRSDIVRENLPDTVKVAREKSRIYFALNASSIPQPGGKSPRKGEVSAKSLKALPPPPSSSFPWVDVLAVSDVRRCKTFHHDAPASDRAGLSTRSTLDSRGTVVTDIQPVMRSGLRPGGFRYLRYPSSTTAPPSTPMTRDYHAPSNTPHAFGSDNRFLQPAKPPSVHIVSFGADSVGSIVGQHEARPRLPAPLKNLFQDASLQNKGTVGTMTGGTSRAGARPGIDLPQLSVRAADAKDASFPHTPRGRPSRMNYSRASSRRSRQRLPAACSKQLKPVKLQADQGDKEDAEQTATALGDPYADRFRQSSTVHSLCDVYIPAPPPASAASHNQDSDTEDEHTGLPEPSIMLTVEEEEEGVDRTSDPGCKLASLREGTGEAKQGSGRGRLSEQGGSCSPSGRSMLSVPTLNVDLSEACPPRPLPVVNDEMSLTTLDLAAAAESDRNLLHTPPPPPPPLLAPPPPPPPPQQQQQEQPMHDEPDLASRDQAELTLDSPDEIASTSLVNTARTIATQTTLPYTPGEASRPKLVKVKTLSMFPDILPPASPPRSPSGKDEPRSLASSETLPKVRLGLTKAAPPGASRPAALLQDPQKEGRSRPSPTGDEAGEDEPRTKSGKANPVRNITFISPLEVQQNAKRC